MDIVVGSVTDRQLAAILAAGLIESGQVRRSVPEEAQSILDWLLVNTVRFGLSVVITDAHGVTKFSGVFQNGVQMPSFAMTMDDTLTLAAAPEDDHGDPTSDALTFTPDNAALVSIAQSGNTATVTPMAEGTVNITVADPAAPNVAASVATVAIGAGPTAAVQLSGTVNVGANVVPPPPPPPPVP